jgi:hypothetical protein
MTCRPKITALAIAGCAALLPVHAAWANCAALLAALDKADAQPRMAMVDVDSPDRAPTAKPEFMRIDKTVYTPMAGGWHTSQATGNSLATQIRAAQTQASGDCQSAGSGAVRGAPVDKVRFDSPSRQNSTGAATIWIDRKSGLPVYHEFAKLSGGGFAWTYGAAVALPADAKPAPTTVGGAAKEMLGGVKTLLGGR